MSYEFLFCVVLFRHTVPFCPHTFFCPSLIFVFVPFALPLDLSLCGFDVGPVCAPRSSDAR